MTRKLLITSVGSGVGTAIIRSLRLVTAPWYTVGVNSAALDASLFACDSAWLVPPTAERVAFEKCLLEIVKVERPAMVIPGRDDDLPILAELSDRLAQDGALALVGSSGAVEICIDKHLTAATLRAAGQPFTETAATRDEIEALVAGCGFPLLVKPRRGFGSRGVRVVFDRAELAATLKAEAQLVVQEYLVPGDWNLTRNAIVRADVERDGALRSGDEIIGEVFLDRSGRTLGTLVTRVDTAFGSPRSLEVLDDPAIEAAAREAAECLGRLGLIGPCNLAGRKLADGSWRIYEVNTRFTGSSAMRAACGFNEVEAAWRHFVEGEDQPNCLTGKSGLVALRQIAETTVRQHELDELRRTERWRPS